MQRDPASCYFGVTDRGLRDDVPVSAPDFPPAWARLVTAWLAAGEDSPAAEALATTGPRRGRARPGPAGGRRGDGRPGPALRDRAGPAGRRRGRGGLPRAQPAPGRARARPGRALLPAGLARRAQPEPRLRRVVVHRGVPRPHRRVRDRGQPARALPARRPAPRAAAAPPARRAPETTLPAPPRRACLFALYDPDGLVDDYVVAYVAELARHADVFVLADCELRARPARAARPRRRRRVGPAARRPRLRLVEPAGARAGRLGRARGVRRGAAGQRLVLAGAAARRGVRARWTRGRATSGGCR